MAEYLEIIPGSIHSRDRGSWNHTRQDTFLWQRISKSHQAVYSDRGCWPCRAGWCLAGLDFDPVWKGWQASYKAIYIFMTEDLEIIPGSIHFYDRGSWNHTRQYTFLWWRILKSCQAIYILMTEDLEIIQGNIHSYDRGFRNHARQYTFPWQRILKSYQAIYIPMTEDLQIIQGSIHSYDGGSWNHTRRYTFL